VTADLGRRVLGLTAWGYLCWVLLTWTATWEFLLVGLVVAMAVAAALAPLGEVAAPWTLLRPRRLLPTARLVADAAGRGVVANLEMARRIWSPGPPLTPGMVIVPTRMRSDAELAGAGIVTSLIVDNQVVDVDRSRHELLYHCVAVPEPPEQRYDAINGPVETRIRDVERPGG
jgi:multicomponent Na+:H+ antiporter subunit E